MREQKSVHLIGSHLKSAWFQSDVSQNKITISLIWFIYQVDCRPAGDETTSSMDARHYQDLSTRHVLSSKLIKLA